jgi:hypothetical protein
MGRDDCRACSAIAALFQKSLLDPWILEALPMTGPKNFRERMEFPVAFILSTLAGLVAFLLVWLLGILWEFYRT